MSEQPKTPKKHNGRPKGVKNRKTLEIEELFRKEGFEPGAGLAWAFKEAVKLYRRRMKRSSTYHAGEALSIAAKIANDAAQYVYPKRKAIEHTGANGEQLFKSFADFIVEIDDVEPDATQENDADLNAKSQA